MINYRLARAACLLGVLSVLLAPAAVHASDYVHRDGYYWKDGYAYTRAQYYQPGYYKCGAYYPGYYYYTYTYVPAYNSASVTYSDPGWRSKLLDIAAARDKIEGEMRKSAAEQRYFTEAVSALGLTGNFRFQNYGADPYGYSPHSNAYAAVNTGGSTLYGYSVKQVADLYGATDMNVLYQQAERLTRGAQDLAGQANTQHGALVQQEGNNKARVAEILAKAELLKSLDQPRATVTKQEVGFKQESTTKADSSAALAQTVDTDIRVAFQAVLKTECLACHSGADAKAKYDLTHWDTMGRAERSKAVLRLTTTDQDKVMPRTKDGHGKRLTDAQVQLFLLN